MNIGQSQIAISPHPGHGAQGPPVMNTLFGSTPLPGIVQFPPVHIYLAYPALSLGPTYDNPSLDIRFWSKNVVIVSRHISQIIESS